MQDVSPKAFRFAENILSGADRLPNSFRRSKWLVVVSSQCLESETIIIKVKWWKTFYQSTNSLRMFCGRTKGLWGKHLYLFFIEWEDAEPETKRNFNFQHKFIKYLIENSLHHN